ncbi:hypothetical protein BKA63DRAFT_587241 [Paraphoma chrysanthemicola]|nr:hypothetical protein BKA63DRAFT_587241 [Paraphoma chrysanthemicola]
MLFRRRSRSHDLPVAQLRDRTKTTVGGTEQSPRSLEQFFASSKKYPTNYRAPYVSDDELEHRNTQAPRRVPTSRKTGFATIRTDSTDTQAAFESDAFAVLMPTTRLPILDRPIPSTKVDSPAARAEALRTYEEKARQVRERNDSQGVKVPSKILSYDYGSRPLDRYRDSAATDKSHPSPAGSFPISPPLQQRTWTRSEQTARPSISGARQNNGLANVSTPRKPIVRTTPTTAASPTSCYRVYRADSTAGASSITSATALPASIKVHIRPKPATPVPQREQIEHGQRRYNREPAASPARPSRSPSPIKSMPNFTRHNSVEGDSIFGYRTKDFSGTAAGAHSKVEANRKQEPVRSSGTDESNKTSPKRTLTSRWPWLRPSGPRIAKPTTAPVVFSAPPAKATSAPKTTVYVDPFAAHATPASTSTPACLRTPTGSRPSPSKKTLTKPITTFAQAIPPPTAKFDTGFAQIQKFTYLVFKICLAIYAIIAIWFVLDAIREAFNTIAAPFRIVKWLGGWIGVLAIWLWTLGLRMWERWGFKVALKGGWMWGVRWW